MALSFNESLCSFIVIDVDLIHHLRAQQPEEGGLRGRANLSSSRDILEVEEDHENYLYISYAVTNCRGFIF